MLTRTNSETFKSTLVYLYPRAQLVGGSGRSSRMRRTAYRWRGYHTSCLCTHLHYLFLCFWQHFMCTSHLHYLFLCFWQDFCLTVHCFICRNLTIPLFKKARFVWSDYFSPVFFLCTWSSYEIAFVINKCLVQDAFRKCPTENLLKYTAVLE